jgi:cytoskeletal protein CcmA (bactofilin family)
MADNQATVVGETILISGNLQGDEDLTVLGRVHGNITLTKTLVVEESGRVKADVDVRNAIISGIVVGNITASDSVELTQQGRVVGDIKAPRVIIVDGARFRGNVDMGDLEAPRASAPLPARTVGTGAPGSKMGKGTGTMSLAKPSAAPTKSTAPAPAKKSAPPPPPSSSGGTATKVSAPPAAAAMAKKAPAAPPAPVALKKKVVVKKKKKD